MDVIVVLLLTVTGIWEACEIRPTLPNKFWAVPVIESEKPTDPPAATPVRVQSKQQPKPMRGLFRRQIFRR
jgi:hypothetical protein